MPKEKDLKRIVRSRMQKTGESYTAARANVIKPEQLDDSLAGMSDEKVHAATGHTWREWVLILDAADGRTRSHADLAKHVKSLGVRDWWSQTVVVGYERIRGKRAYGQRMDQTWEVSRSRTFSVTLATLFDAIANQRDEWLTGITITRATSTKNKSVRLKFDDGSNADLRLTIKSPEKTILGVGHMKLASKEIAERKKVFWNERLDALKKLLA